MADKSNPMFDMFQKFGENLKLPMPEIEKVVDYHRKNIEAMQESMMAASSGAKEVMEKQREQLEAGLADVTQHVEKLTSSKDPAKMMSDNMEFARKSFETTIKNATEIGEITRDSSTKSFEVMRKRMQESVDDIRDSMSKKD